MKDNGMPFSAVANRLPPQEAKDAEAIASGLQAVWSEVAQDESLHGIAAKLPPCLSIRIPKVTAYGSYTTNVFIKFNASAKQAKSPFTANIDMCKDAFAYAAACHILNGELGKGQSPTATSSTLKSHPDDSSEQPVGEGSHSSPPFAKQGAFEWAARAAGLWNARYEQPTAVSQEDEVETTAVSPPQAVLPIFHRFRAEARSSGFLNFHLRHSTAVEAFPAVASPSSGRDCWAVPGPAPESWTFRAIGSVVSCYRQKFGTPRQGFLAPHSRARIELRKEFGAQWLAGLSDFSHVWLIFMFDSVASRGAVAIPKGGEDRVGVFATRTPHRPNPIGLTWCRLLAVKDQTLLVGGSDLVQGTYILDVKPYHPLDIVPSRDLRIHALWLKDSGQSTGAIRTTEFKNQFQRLLADEEQIRGPPIDGVFRLANPRPQAVEGMSPGRAEPVTAELTESPFSRDLWHPLGDAGIQVFIAPSIWLDWFEDVVAAWLQPRHKLRKLMARYAISLEEVEVSRSLGAELRSIITAISTMKKNLQSLTVASIGYQLDNWLAEMHAALQRPTTAGVAPFDLYTSVSDFAAMLIESLRLDPRTKQEIRDCLNGVPGGARGYQLFIDNFEVIFQLRDGACLEVTSLRRVF